MPRWAGTGTADPAEPDGARGARGCRGKGGLTTSVLSRTVSLCPALLPGQAARCQEPDGRFRQVPARPAALLRVSMEGSTQLRFWCRITPSSPRRHGPGAAPGAHRSSAWEKSVTKSAVRCLHVRAPSDPHGAFPALQTPPWSSPHPTPH